MSLKIKTVAIFVKLFKGKNCGLQCMKLCTSRVLNMINQIITEGKCWSHLKIN